MPGYFLGIDTGGTKSHALIADETGRALGFAESGPGNPEMIGYEGLTELLRTILDEALTTAGIGSDQIAGAGLGIGGYDWPSQRRLIEQALQPLGLPAFPFTIANDAIIGLLAGAAEGWGVCVIAGTGCNCYGWDEKRRVGRVTGFGAKMGEGAGSIELVERAIQAVALEWTRRGPATRLTRAFTELTGAASPADLLEGLSLGTYRLSAAAAPVIFKVAAKGDRVAHDLVEWAGRELGDLAVGVIRQLKFEAKTFDVVLAGSFYNGSPWLVAAMEGTIAGVAPGAHLVRLTAPPVVGGVLLGMEQAGLKPAPLRETLIASTQELRQRNNEVQAGPTEEPTE